MRKKKFLSLFALVLLAVLAFGGEARAITPAPDPRFGESKWAYCNNDSSLRYNCYMFARHVIATLKGEVMFNSYTNNYRNLYKNSAGDLDNYRIGYIFKEYTTINATNLKSAFSNAKAGDVVQMYWNGWNDTSHSPNQHTFIIAAKDDSGILVLQANTGNYNQYDENGNYNPYYNTTAINNRYYSWSTLASMYSIAGSYGGCSIYRFLDDVPIGISIADTFPDSNFQSYIRSNIDTNGDGRLNASEIANVTEIKVANSGISDLTGIKNFYNLSWLECNNNRIKTLDLSNMTKLTSIWCWENGMESLNVSGCTELPCIWAKDNNLKTLNVEGCNKLDTIYAWNNGFTSLTINNLPKLKYLDLSNCKSLKELDCSNNVLETLYVGNCAVLEKLTVNVNKLTSIGDLSTCTKLKYVNRDSNVQLTGCSAPVITTSSLSNAAVGKEYYAKVNASGTGIITYTLSAVAKSNGFLCDGNEPCATGCTNGIINGIPKYERDSLTFTVKATNFVGSTSKTFTIKITPKIVAPVITTSNSSQIEAITKQSFFLQDNKTFEGFTATGDNITWSISKGKLPVGLALDSATGKFVGTPDYTEEGKTSNRGVSYTFSVTATNGGGSDTKEFTMNVFESPIITTADGALKDGYVGEAYSADINATGSNTFMLWDIESGAFPNGLDFDIKQMDGTMSAGPRKAIIAGTPTRAGKYPFKVTVMSGNTGKAYYTGLIKITDNKNPGEYATKDFSIQIADKPVINGSFPNGMVGVFYDSVVKAKGGFSPYSYSINGKYPQDLTCAWDSGFGEFSISGTPRTEGEYSFTLNLTDKNGKTDTKYFSFKVVATGVKINSTNFPDSIFRSYVSTNFDKDGNGYLSDTEISVIKTIDVNNKNIANLKGIEFFTALEELICDGNKLSVLDVSKNTALKTLHCSKNSLTSLNLSNNKLLENVECDNNKLTALDISKNLKLDYLSCSGNSIVKLDVSNNTSLKWLYCNGNQLTELILGNNSVLQEVSCEGNSSLKTLDIEGCSNLSETNVKGDVGLEFIANKDTITPEDEEIYNAPAFKGRQPVLEGQIVVNFYADMPGAENGYHDNSYVNFKVLNDTTYNPTQPFDKDFKMTGNFGTYYGFRCNLTSIQMADPITAVLHYGDHEPITYEYSLKTYLDKYYNSESSSTALKNLTAAMKDYCYYVQVALSETNGWKLGVDHVTMDYVHEYDENDLAEVRQAVSSYAIERNTGNSGIQSIAYNLELDSDTTLNLYLRPASNYTGSVHAFARGVVNEPDTSKNLIYGRDSQGRYMIKISGIAAHQLADTNTIMVVTEKETFYIKVSVLSYINTVFTSTNAVLGSENMKKAVTSMYKYYKATQAYRESL